MKHIIYGFLLALQFLTRLPVPVECPWNERSSRWAIRFYPVVGLLGGALLVLAAWLLQPYVPAVVLALLMVTLWVWFTGGLHLDGVMDVADAVGSNGSLEKKWQIMKDPHVGSFGIIALFFLLGWKTVLVYMLIETGGYAVLATFPAVMGLARFAAVCLLIFLPAAKKEGLAWHWQKNLTAADAGWAFVPVLIVLAGAALPVPGLWFAAIGFLSMAGLYGLWVMRTFKGVNGDLAGTAIEGGEVWGLLLVWMCILYVTG